MLRISLQTLRARRGTLAGAFVAIWLAVTLACATGLLMAGALGAPGAGGLSAADAVVRADPTVTIGRGEDAEALDVVPAPRLPVAMVERAAAVPGVARAIGDIAFAAGAWDAGGRHLDAAKPDPPARPARGRAGRPPRRRDRGPARRPRLGQRGAHAVPPCSGPCACWPARRRRRRPSRHARRRRAAHCHPERGRALSRQRPRR